MEKQSNLNEAERAIWTDAYRFHATFAKMGNEPEDWEKCCQAMTQLYHNHGDHDLAKLLLLAVYDHLSNQRKTGADASG